MNRTALEHILAAILSGLLLAAAFPKWNQTYLLFFALIPLYWALQGKSLKAAFGLGLVSGLAYYLALLYWIVYVTHVFGHLSLPLSLVVLLLLAGYLSLYRALWALGLNWGAAQGLSLLWWGPVLWVALELGQTYIITGFPWELLGNGLFPHPLLLQVADLTGVYGLSFLVVLINVGLGRSCGRPGPGAPGAFAICRCSPWCWPAGWAMVITAWGAPKTGGPEPENQGGRGPGQHPAGRKVEEGDGAATLERYAELTRQVKGAQLIVWPETAAPFFFLTRPRTSPPRSGTSPRRAAAPSSSGRPPGS